MWSKKERGEGACVVVTAREPRGRSQRDVHELKLLGQRAHFSILALCAGQESGELLASHLWWGMRGRGGGGAGGGG